MRSRKWLLCVLAVVLAAGCTSSGSSNADPTSGTGTGSGTGGTTGAADTVGPGGGDATGTATTGGSTDAAAPFKCTANDQCSGTAPVCDCLGRCVAAGLDGLGACTEDANCGSANYCDTCASVCRTRKGLCEPCTDPNECEDDAAACVDFASGGRYCLRGCEGDPGCPQPSFRCKDVPGHSTKQCIPVSGLCEKPSLCDGDGECPYGQVCEGGQCAAGCPGDEACPDGKVCTAFRCVGKCPDAPCPTGQECKPDGHCKVPGGCVEPSECPLPETFCDMEALMCTPGCLQDFDCKASSKVCKDMTCVDKGCKGNYECAFSQVCSQETAKCEDAVGPYCEPGCDTQSDAACGGKPNMCLELQDEDGNSLGTFCFVACGPDPQNPCPQGYACIELKDQDGNVQGEICHRDCTYSPI